MPISNRRNITTAGFDEDALATILAGDEVLNFGSLTTTGDLANGIYAGADDVGVDNFGSIETNGDGAEGILIEGDGARVRNLGSIVTFGGPTDDFLHFSDAIAVYGDNFDLENRGDIETHGLAPGGMAGYGAGGQIRNFGSISTTGAFSSGLLAFGNGGVIQNFSSISISGDFSSALFAFGDGSVIQNFGSIDTSGFVCRGLLAAGDHNIIVNLGVITIADPFAFGPAMDGFGSFNEVVNYGEIVGGMFAGAARILDGVGNVASNWGTISSHSVETAVLVTGHDALAQNFGTIDAMAGGVAALGDAGAIARNTGAISTIGDLASALLVGAGAGGEASNGGSIRTEGAGAAGIDLLSVTGGQVTNSGDIETFGGRAGLFDAAGVTALGMDVLVHNTSTGVIETHDPDSAAVLLNDHDVPPASFRPAIIAADTHARLENEGEIRAVQTALRGGAGDETVVNRGLIVGDVILNDGDDAFVFGAGGELDGELFLGSGNDLVVLQSGSGTSRVADFAAGAASGDVIDVSAFFSSMGQLQEHSFQNGGDVVVDLGESDVLVLKNVQLTDLEADDFLFADSAASAAQSRLSTLAEEPSLTSSDSIFG